MFERPKEDLGGLLHLVTAQRTGSDHLAHAVRIESGSQCRSALCYAALGAMSKTWRACCVGEM